MAVYPRRDKGYKKLETGIYQYHNDLVLVVGDPRFSRNAVREHYTGGAKIPGKLEELKQRRKELEKLLTRRHTGSTLTDEPFIYKLFDTSKTVMVGFLVKIRDGEKQRSKCFNFLKLGGEDIAFILAKEFRDKLLVELGKNTITIEESNNGKAIN